MKNPVAKNLNRFNKPATQVDRKKRAKRGGEKYRKTMVDYRRES